MDENNYPQAHVKNVTLIIDIIAILPTAFWWAVIVRIVMPAGLRRRLFSFFFPWV